MDFTLNNSYQHEIPCDVLDFLASGLFCLIL